MHPKHLVTLLVLLALSLGTPGALAQQPNGTTPQGDACTPGLTYDPACDVNHDGLVDLNDLQLTAGHWNQAGTYSSGSWDLTGNAGTNPTTNFVGTTDPVSLTLIVSGTAALRIVPATNPTYGYVPNLIGGYRGNTVAAGVVGATIGGGGAGGAIHQVNGDFGTIGGGYHNTVCIWSGCGVAATVGGGKNNTAGHEYATVSGGTGNTASANGANIGGGFNNAASGLAAMVGGGQINTASGPSTTVAGGQHNQAYGNYDTVGGGDNNVANGGYGTANGHATVAGGSDNTATGHHATVGGGDSNTASGPYATIPGGWHNQASGAYSFAAGHQGWASHEGVFVWADNSTTDTFQSTASNQFLIRAAGGVGIGTAAPQSSLHVVGNYIQFPARDTAPPTADCDSPLEAGRVVVRTNGPPDLYICRGASGWVSK